MLLESPVEPTLQCSEDFVVGIPTTMIGVDTESFVENDTPRNDFLFVPLFFAPLENHFSIYSRVCGVYNNDA